MEKFNSTQEMISVRLTSRAFARETAENLIRMARQAHDARVDLPAANPENGEPVLHGANREMSYIRDNFMDAFSTMMPVIGRDYHDLLRYKYRHASVGNGRGFQSEESWKADCSHLDGEMARLQKLVDEGRDT